MALQHTECRIRPVSDACWSSAGTDELKQLFTAVATHNWQQLRADMEATGMDLGPDDLQEFAVVEAAEFLFVFPELVAVADEITVEELADDFVRRLGDQFKQ